MIKAVFPETVATESSVGAPAQDVIENAKAQFVLIQDKKASIEAFNVVMKGANSTNEIVKQFYDILPVEHQNELKGHMHAANDSQDDGHGFGYGEYIVHNQIRSTVARQAVENYIKALAPVVTTTSTTTSTTSV